MKPNIHKFRSNEEAYDESQTDDAIKDGDILVTPKAVAILVKAWPVVVHGDGEKVLHQLHKETWETLDRGKYLGSYKLAKNTMKLEAKTASFKNFLNEGAKHNINSPALKPFIDIFGGSKPTITVNGDKIEAKLEKTGSAPKWHSGLEARVKSAGFTFDADETAKLSKGNRSLYLSAYKHKNGATLVTSEHTGMGSKYVVYKVTLVTTLLEESAKYGIKNGQVYVAAQDVDRPGVVKKHRVKVI